MDKLGLNMRQGLIQFLIVPTGILFGVIEYYILRPDPLISNFSWSQIIIPALILLVSTGFFEEIAFRGIMQSTALETLGRFGIVYIALIFAVLHIGYLSVLDVVFVFAVGLFFGWIVVKTGSIIGVTFSHGLTNIVLFLVMPFFVAISPSSSQAAFESELEAISTIAPAKSDEQYLATPRQQTQVNTQQVQLDAKQAIALNLASNLAPPPELTPAITPTPSLTEVFATLLEGLKTSGSAIETIPDEFDGESVVIESITQITQTNSSTAALATVSPQQSVAPSIPTSVAMTESIVSSKTLSTTEQPVPTPTVSEPVYAIAPKSTVVALKPADGYVSHEIVVFEWSTDQPLRTGQRFELVFWGEDQEPLVDGVGLAIPEGNNSVDVNLKKLDIMLRDRFNPGHYQWGLVLVQTEPNYERLAYLGGGRTLIFQN